MRKAEMARRIEELEQRDQDATDVLINQLQINSATAPAGKAEGLAVIESCAGILARALASAEIASESPAMATVFTPRLRHRIGRALIRRGAFLGHIRSGPPRVLEAVSGSTTGGPETWQWELTVPGPSRVSTLEYVPVENVLFIPWDTDPNKPWIGLAPHQLAGLSSTLAAALTKALGDEAGGPRGSLLPVPDVGAAGDLATTISSLRGAVGLVPSVSSWANADQSRGSAARGLGVMRVGFDAPASASGLLTDLDQSLAAACGVPPELLMVSATRRESHLRFLRETASPVADMISAATMDTFGISMTLTWPELRLEDARNAATVAKLEAEAQMHRTAEFPVSAPPTP